MSDLEIEVKFFLPDLCPIRGKLLSLGAVSEGRNFESNIRFETGDNALARAGALLRLRKDRRCTLTYKSLPESVDAEFKIHRELQIVVSDHDTTRNILEALGFRPAQTYEKFRETFRFASTVVCLDTMPFGNFIEIEGSKEAIRRAVQRLELDWSDRLLCNYLELFDGLRRRLGLPFTDLTFDHFKGLEPNIIGHHLNAATGRHVR